MTTIARTASDTVRIPPDSDSPFWVGSTLASSGRIDR